MWKKDYRELGKTFVEEMHLFHHRNISEYAMKVSLFIKWCRFQSLVPILLKIFSSNFTLNLHCIICPLQTYNQVHKISTFFTNFLLLQMVSGVIFFNTSPVLHNLATGMYSHNPPANGTYAHSCYYALPFDYTTNFIGYLAVFLTNCILTFDAGSCLCVYDLYISLIVFHAWGHLKILDYHLRHFPRPAMEGKVNELENPAWYSEEESKTVTAMLKKHVNHHRLIMKWVHIMNDTISYILQYNFYLSI